MYSIKDIMWICASILVCQYKSTGYRITTALASQPTGTQVSEATSAKTVIGGDSSSADGVLVLESTTKSMILPIVSDVQNIPSPSPGMKVYINKNGAGGF